MARGRPAGLRLETAERRQVEFQQSCLDDLLAADQPAAVLPAHSSAFLRNTVRRNSGAQITKKDVASLVHNLR